MLSLSVCETLFFANARRKNCINLVHVWLGQDAKRIDVPFPTKIRLLVVLINAINNMSMID